MGADLEYDSDVGLYYDRNMEQYSDLFQSDTVSKEEMAAKWARAAVKQQQREESFEQFEHREKVICAVITARRCKGLPCTIGIDWFPSGWKEWKGELWMRCHYRDSASGRWKMNCLNRPPHFVKLTSLKGENALHSHLFQLRNINIFFSQDHLVLDVYSNSRGWKVKSK